MAIRAGVVAVQGDVSENVEAVRRGLEALGAKGTVAEVRRGAAVRELDAIVLPGGESTTISKLIRSKGISGEILALARRGGAVLGTCAGAILLADEGDDQVAKTSTELLGLMEMSVDRNFFGRQRESFEAPVRLEPLGGEFSGVFIRAPAIRSVRGGCAAKGWLPDGTIVAAEQGNCVALAFHPELTRDTRVHEWFLRRVA